MPTHQLYLLVCGVLVAALSIGAQSPPPTPAAARAGYDLEYIGPPLADPVMQHSKETYVVMGCAYCHGMYLVPRGEAADLRRSPLVGGDENANLIGPLLRAGIPQTTKLSPMPQYSDLSDQQISDIARWIHYARQRGRYDELTAARLDAGDPAAGSTYFDRTCGSCHSVARDLAQIGRKHAGARLVSEICHPPRICPAAPVIDRPGSS
jgi:mono/diheme cytochrome c family protein